MKKIFALFAAIMLCVSAFAENLVINPEFSVDDSGLYVDDWYGESYRSENSQLYLDTDLNALAIYSYDMNDARWMQYLDVKGNTVYRFSCEIMASGIPHDGRGANISILNTNVYSESVYETEGEWQEVSFYGKTQKEQDEITLCLRLGGYSGDNTGNAWFRNIRVEKAKAPAGETPQSLATFEPAKHAETKTVVSGLPERNTEMWCLFAGITVFVFFFLMCRVKDLNREEMKLQKEEHNTAGQMISFITLMVVSFILRIFISAKVHGYHVDINCFACWSDSMAENGFNFYADGGFCDYPPVYMMLLGIIGKIRTLFRIPFESTAHIVLIKLIPELCDMAAAVCAYFLFRKKAGHTRAMLLCCAIALSPAFIADSAAWGQADSVMSFILCIAVYAGMNGAWQYALPVFALSVLTKPQALMFGPIGLIVCAVDIICNKKQWKKALIGVFAAFALIFIVSLPFSRNICIAEGDTGIVHILASPFAWIWKQLFGAANGYRYLTVNACNLYELLDKNWNQLSGGGLAFFAWAMFGLSYVITAALAVIGRKRNYLPLLGSLLIALLFAFAPMMHERYLFPVLMLCVLAYTELKDKRILVYLGFATATEFLNIILVLLWGMTPGFETSGHLQGSEQTLNAIVSACNVALAMYLLYVTADIILAKHIRRLTLKGECSKEKAEWLNNVSSDYKLHIKKRDALLMAGVTLLYSLVAFTNLGNTVSPQSAWTNTEFREQVVFDLGEERTFRFTYFGGISSVHFTVALSNDGENWSEENYAEFADGMMYNWMWYVPKTYSGGAFANASEPLETATGGAQVTYADYSVSHPLQTARYLRITAEGVGLILNEVGFIDADSECLYPVHNVYGTVEGTDYSVLIDEQSMVPIYPSYMNSMYFDEIYHARTAYEMLHGFSAGKILEWSHPHLGKLIIALGIKICGMTPFGWRFTGTLFGALMLPVFYLLIKQLTGKSNLSFLGMVLMALDSMHFTQTRLATVDTYAVFFIMLMYLFMIRYYKMNLHRDKFIKTLVPIALSGFFMGCAWSAKWTGIYASAGLAVIFFLTVFQRIREYRILKDNDFESDGFGWKLLVTLLCCIIFFVAIPVLMYYFSYYWHFRTSGGLTVGKVWELQKQMYGYHSGLVDDHFFKSPWYQWPFIGKPMWYYSADIDYTGRGIVSSISCMGNPAVWWTGIIAFIICLAILAVRRKTDHRLLIIAIGFASQFLPWVLVPRSTFIYHYFASVPFIIMATVLLIEYFESKYRKAAFVTSVCLMCAALILFAMFYPLESGVKCSYDYAMLLRWFDWYNFALQ